MAFGTGNYAADFFNALSAPDHEAQFPANISWGAKVGPGYSTVITEIGSGWEQRAQNWPAQRIQYEVSHLLKSQQDVDILLAFFYARRGRAHSFRFKDWSDYSADHEQVIIRPDGLGYQLTKFYNDPSNPYIRIIEKPCTGLVTDATGNTPPPVTLYDSGGGIITGFIDHTTGIVTGAAPAMWSGEFDVRARFEQDLCQFDQQAWNDANWNNIQLIEIRTSLPASSYGGIPVRTGFPKGPVNNSNVLLTGSGGGGLAAVRRAALSGVRRFGITVGNFIHFDIPRTSPGNAVIVLCAALGSDEFGPITINNVWDGDLTTNLSKSSTPASFDTFQSATGAPATARNVAESMGLTAVASVRAATAAALPSYAYGIPASPNAVLSGWNMSCAGNPVTTNYGGAIAGAGMGLASNTLSATSDTAVLTRLGIGMSAHPLNQKTVALTGLAMSAITGSIVSTPGWGLVIYGAVTPSTSPQTVLVNIYGRINGVVSGTTSSQIAAGTSVTITSDTASFDGTFNISEISIEADTITLSWNQVGADEIPASPLSQLVYDVAAGLIVDGVVVANNDRILLKDGATATDNGIYVVNDNGAVSSRFILQRAADCDGNNYISGVYAPVLEGTTNGGLDFYVQTANPIIVGITSITWASFDPGSGTIALNAFTRASDIVTASTLESPPPSGATIIITNSGSFNGRFILGDIFPVRVGSSIQGYTLTWVQTGSDESLSVDGLLTYSTGLPTGSTDIWYCISGRGGATRIILDTTLTQDKDNSQLAIWVLEFAGLTQLDHADHINNQAAASKLVTPTLSSTTTLPAPELFVAVQFSNAISVACDPLGWVWCGAKKKTSTPVIPNKCAAAAYTANVGDLQVGFVQNRPGGGCVSIASFK